MILEGIILIRWWVKQDLNLQQHRYERWALTIELLTHLTVNSVPYSVPKQFLEGLTPYLSAKSHFLFNTL